MHVICTAAFLALFCLGTAGRSIGGTSLGALISLHSFHPSAHHGGRHLGDLLPIDGHSAVVDDAGRIIIEGRSLGRDIDDAAIDGDTAIGINRIGIACAHRDIQRTVIDDDLYRINGGFRSGIDAVI